MRKLTIEKFIDKAKSIYGNEYDYSLVEYINSYTKIKIICQIHGIFEQTPKGHIWSGGCRKCGDLKRINKLSSDTEEFIRKAKLVHGDKYDYSLVEYTNRANKVKIICHKHGIFETRAGTHVANRRGCSKCRVVNLFLTTDNFIQKAKIKHKDKYDYSLVIYINNRTSVKIICKKHGTFEQSPAAHIAGSGCRKCFVEDFSLTTQEFINKSKRIHGNKYNYSLVKYTNAQKKVIIICKKHGEFKQIANGHLTGQGCPVCKSSRGEEIISLFLENNKIRYEREKRFNECRNPITNYILPFDFYLVEQNTLVEFDGKQHFINNEKWEHLEKIKFRDEIKNKFAKENGIRLIRIPYTEVKNINEILANSILDI